MTATSDYELMCLPNLLFCQATQQYSPTELESLNANYEGSFNQFCYLKCFTKMSLPSTSALFYDPRTKRCGVCSSSLTSCKKKFTFKRWFLGTSQISRYEQLSSSVQSLMQSFELVTVSDVIQECDVQANFVLDYFEMAPKSISAKYRGFETYYQEQFKNFSKMLDLNQFTEFEYQVNFIVSADTSLNQVNDFLTKSLNTEIIFKGNIDKLVFRVLKKKLVVNTVHYQTGETNRYYVTLGFFSGQQITFSGWSTVELHNIIFFNRDSVPYNFHVRFWGLMHESAVQLHHIRLQEEQSYSIFSFILEDVLDFTVVNFETVRQSTQPEGWELFIFKFSQSLVEDSSKQQKLNITGLYLQNFLFNEQSLFNLQLHNQRALFDDIRLKDCIFYKSQFIQ